MVVARRRLRYETWYFIHLYAYLGDRAGVQPPARDRAATSSGDAAARAYWYVLYAVTLGAVVAFRIAWPLARSACATACGSTRVVEEAPGVVSVEIGGVRLERLRAQTGQFFTWRFLTRDRWWEAHPFSLSAAPDGQRLRITVKGVGDYTARPAGDRARARRVIAEGPFGVVHARPRGGARAWR